MKVQFIEKVFRVLFIFIFVLGTAWTPQASVRADAPQRGHIGEHDMADALTGGVRMPARSPQYGPFTSCNEVTEIPPAECEALVALYNSTNGAGWTNNTGWLQTDNPSGWFGVTVSGGHVIVVNLWDNHLTGTLPNQFVDLAYLQEFWFPFNQLSGPLPSGLGNLTSLRVISLSGNSLSGIIPAELGNLSNIQYLWMNNNSFNGEIPASLSNLDSMISLSLHDNQLTGSIPTELGNLGSIVHLGLQRNSLSGEIPNSLGNLVSLNDLFLNDNNLSGNLPAQLGSLTNLQSLGLEHNQLSGEIPVSITNLTNLTSLTLSCALTSTNPVVISFLNEKSPGWQSALCLPDITVQPDHGWIQGQGWPFGTTITLTVDDDTNPGNGVLYQDSKITGPAPWNANQSYVQFQPEETVDLVPGQYVTLTGATLSKSMQIEDVDFINVNTATDVASGRGPALHHANVDIGSGGTWSHLTLLIGSDGNWTADFGAQSLTIPDDYDDAHITVLDEDGDGTMAHYQPTHIEARANEERVEGYEWPVGATLILEIDDPATVDVDPDYTASGTVEVAEWDSSQTYVEFVFYGLYDLKSGDEVTLSDGATTKQHTVTNLTITNVDSATDIVTGTVEAGSHIRVWACDDDYRYCATREEDADESGNWSTDFGDPSQPTFDIVPGTWVDSEQKDAEYDVTLYMWRVWKPYVEANAQYDWAHAREWPLGTEVTLTIDDPDNGVGIDYTTIATMQQAPWWNPGKPNEIAANFDLQDYDIQVGDHLTATVGSESTTLIVSGLEVTGFNVSTDTLSGVATPGAEVQLCANVTDNCIDRWVIADETTGTWMVSYAGEFDLQPGSNGWAVEYEMNGDQTWYDWSVPNPRIEILDYADRIALIDWPAGQTVHVSIDTPSTGPSPDYEQDFTPQQEESYYEFFTTYDIHMGDVITATNGAITKTLVVATLQATVIDADNGTVQGVAAPNSQFDMSIWGDQFNASPVEDLISVDGTGNWSADYSDVPGGVLPWTWLIRGEMRQEDADGDVTLAYWHRHWSILEVWLAEAELRACDWEPGATLTFTVDDPSTPQPVDFTEVAQATRVTWMDHGMASVSVRGKLDLRPGMIVTVTDGVLTKSTVIQNIGFNVLDTDNNLVAGFAPPNADLDISISKGYWSHRYFSADGNGDWSVDYDIPDPAGRTLDLQPGDPVDGLLMRDAEFDSTAVSTSVPEPKLQVNVNDSHITARNWPSGHIVTLTIDNPTTPQSPDYTTTRTTGPFDWDPNESGAEFILRSVYDYQLGDEITVTDGTLSKTLIVENVAVTEIDPAAETISGTTDPSVEIEVNIDQGNAPYRRVTADEDGQWSVDFSTPWNNQTTYNLTPGLVGSVERYDADGDKSTVGWRVPDPYIEASAQYDGVRIFEWSLGSEVTLTIDGAEGPYTATATMQHVPWNPDAPYDTMATFDLQGYNLQVGDSLTATVGAESKTLIISAPEVTGFDLENDIISGIATPGADLRICANPLQESMNRFVTADPTTGVWTADFTGDSDLQPDSEVIVEELDDDGDRTGFHWGGGDPMVIDARWNNDRIEGVDWLWASTVSLEIDDPATPQNPDYSASEVVDQTRDWDHRPYVSFALNGVYDLKPGDEVTLSDTYTTKQHLVTSLTITAVNLATDVVSGTAQAGSHVDLWACVGDVCANRAEDADQAGNWSTDFGDSSQPTLDLIPGTWVDSMQSDADNDATFSGWYVPYPSFSVRFPENEIHGYGWLPGSSVTLMVDDPNTPQPVDYTDLQTVGMADWDPNQTSVTFRPSEDGFSLERGMTVTLSDGQFTKSHIATPLSVTTVDQVADTVAGTAVAGSEVEVGIQCDEITCQGVRRVTANGSGNWIVDFAHAGEGDDEQGIFNLGFGTRGAAHQLDADDDFTNVRWRLLNSRFHAQIVQNNVEGYDWPLGLPVTLTIDDLGTGIGVDLTRVQSVSPRDDFAGTVSFDDLGGLQLAPGMIVTMTNGQTTKTHTITNLVVTGVDLTEDTVWGTGTPGAGVNVQYCGQGGCLWRRWVTIGLDSTWLADFSLAGPNPGEELILDIRPNMYGEAIEPDADTDHTDYRWGLFQPDFVVPLGSHEIYSEFWPLGANVTVTVDDISNGSGTDFSSSGIVVEHPDNPEEMNWIEFMVPGFTLDPGDLVVMSDGTFTKELILTPLAITGIDLVEDTVSGTAIPDAEIWVWARDDAGEWGSRKVTTGEEGNWTADFSVAGPTPDEDFIVDITPGSHVEAAHSDADGDTTEVGEIVPNPRIDARPNQEIVSGAEWPLGATVTLEVDDPATPELDPDYTETKVVIMASWDPNQTDLEFRFNGLYDLKPGDEVTLSNGTTMKQHTVTAITITAIDPVADIVMGTAEAGSQVQVVVCDEDDNCASHDTSADQDGNWSTDFGDPSQATFDIVPGTWVDSVQRDAEFDGTLFGQTVPNPRVEASAQYDWVHARGWSLNTEVTLTIAGPGGPYTTTAVIEQAPWNPSDPNDLVALFDLQGYNIQVGDNLTATVGNESKTLIVSALAVTGFDVAADTVLGVATPGSEVEVCANTTDNCAHRHVTADGTTGTWTADYAGEFDLQPGSNGWTAEADGDGDQTWYDWRVPNPTISVLRLQKKIEGYEWPLGATVTLSIDDPSIPGWPEYQNTQTVEVASWDSTQTLVAFSLGNFALQPGQFVTLADGVTYKTHQVRDLVITEVDAETDRISGTAEPGALIEIGHMYCDETGCYAFRRVTADELGNWVVDFGHVGEDDDEQDLYDITPGTTGEVRAPDMDGDNTNVPWYAGWTAPATVPLVVALSSNPSLVNFSTDTNTWTVLNLLMESPFRYGPDGSLVPAAATSYSLSPDGRVYTITLRSDAVWSDGVPVTAQHFVDGLLFQLDAQNNFDYASLLFPIEGAQAFYNGTITDPNLVGVTALNATTLQVTLTAEASHFTKILASSTFLPLRLDWIALHPNDWAEGTNFIGNGPYKIDEHDGAHLLLSPNPYYYNPGRLAYSQIGFSIIPEAQYQVQAYQNGEVDIAFNLSLSYDPGPADVVLLPRPGIQFLGFNVARAPTDNLLVRQALVSAINKEQLLEALDSQWMLPATSMVPPEIPGSQYGTIGYDYNLTQAQIYLANAGYPGGVGLPEIQLVANSAQKILFDEIAAQWRSALGIQVRVTYYSYQDYAALRQDCLANPAACPANALRLGWLTDYPDPYNILSDLFEYADVAPGWQNVTYNDLIASSEAADPVQRLLDLQAAEQILVEDDAAVLPLHHYNSINLVRPGIYPVPVPTTPYLDLWTPCYTLTLNADPVGSGGITANPEPNCDNGTKYRHGTAVELTALANPGYEFTAWGGDVTGSTNPLTINMDEDKSVAANFETIPVVTSIVRQNTTPSSRSTVFFLVTFSEPVTGVDAADFLLTTTGDITGASIVSVTDTDATRTVAVNTGSGDGTLRLDLVDGDSIQSLASVPLGGTGAGNGDFTTGEAYTIDKTVPTVVASARMNPNPTARTTVFFLVTFSESVTGVNAADFALTTSGYVGSVSIASVTGTGSTRTVAVNTGTGNGTLRLDLVDNDSIKDAAGISLGGNGPGNGSFNTGQEYTINKPAPRVVSITRQNNNPSNRATVFYLVTFSETVTGLSAADFALATAGEITGVSIASVSGSGATRTVAINTGTGNGTLRLDVVDDDSVKNAALIPLGGLGLGNGDFITGQVYTIDKLAPTVVSITRLNGNPTSRSTVYFSVTFSESVMGVGAADFALTITGNITGASIASVSGSGMTRTVVVNTGTGDGTLRLDLLDDDSIKDPAALPLGGTGTGNGDFTTGQSYTVDKP